MRDAAGRVRYRGGVLVDGRGERWADLVVEGGKILAEIPTDQAYPGGLDEQVDLGGRFVLPGLVDAHVHFGLSVGAGRSSEGILDGTRRCLSGGVTTVADFAGVPEPDQSLAECMELRRQEFQGTSVCDFLFHYTVPGGGRWDKEIRSLAQGGSSRFKVFTTYRQRGLMSSEAELTATFRAVAGTRSQVWAHCEADAEVESATVGLREQGHLGAAFLGSMRPPEAEIRAIGALIEASRRTGAALHIVHISTLAGALAVRKARAEGVAVTGETCPHYLVWDKSAHERTDGYRWTMAPPLRSPEDGSGLWRELSPGGLDLVTTDSCGFPDEWKEFGAFDVSAIPMGICSAGMILPVLWTLGVKAGRLSLQDLVRVTSQGPAKTLGVFPRKGTLAPGADADFLVVSGENDLELRGELSASLYRERTWSGWPLMVVRGGRRVLVQGRLGKDLGAGVALQ